MNDAGSDRTDRATMRRDRRAGAAVLMLTPGRHRPADTGVQTSSRRDAGRGYVVRFVDRDGVPSLWFRSVVSTGPRSICAG
jgi:hypothetical protein